MGNVGLIFRGVFWIMKTVLVTGCAGFIGSRLASHLIRQGHEVVGVDSLSVGKPLNVPNKVKFYKGDLSDKNVFEHLPRQIDYVFHLAGQSSGEKSFHDPVSNLTDNLITTLNALSYAEKIGVEEFFFASSMSVYGNYHFGESCSEDYGSLMPISHYGISKLAGELSIRLQSSVPTTSLRLFNVYGPGQDLGRLDQGMVSIYIAYALSRQKVLVKGQLSRVRDFVFIDDVLSILEILMNRANSGHRVLNVGTGIGTSVQELLQIIDSLIGKIQVEVTSETPGDQKSVIADTKRLINTIGPYNFVTIQQGLVKFIESIKK